jgi:hypothetical protein
MTLSAMTNAEGWPAATAMRDDHFSNGLLIGSPSLVRSRGKAIWPHRAWLHRG